MNSDFVQIIDRGLAYSIWVFLVAFVIFLLYARIRMRRRRRAVGELYAQEVAGVEDSKSRPEPLNPLLLNQWRIAFQTLWLALIVSLFFFLAFIFTPLPFFENFATADSWKISPLRLTSLNYDRYYEGFSLQGEVWNQTEEPMQGLLARVTVIGTDEERLAELEVPIEPEVLAAGTAGGFEVSYDEKSPFIKGYRVSFIGPLGEDVPHVAGFDER